MLVAHSFAWAKPMEIVLAGPVHGHAHDGTARRHSKLDFFRTQLS